MVSIESEVMLIGKWKTFSELEDTLTIEELEAIVKAMREKEHRQFKMMAAVQGINLDEEEQPHLTVEDVKAKVAARLSGRSDDEWEMNELGLDMETEE